MNTKQYKIITIFSFIVIILLSVTNSIFIFNDIKEKNEYTECYISNSLDIICSNKNKDKFIKTTCVEIKNKNENLENACKLKILEIIKKKNIKKSI